MLALPLPPALPLPDRRPCLAVCSLPRCVRRAGLALRQQGEEADEGVAAGWTGNGLEHCKVLGRANRNFHVAGRCGASADSLSLVTLLCVQSMKFPPEFSTKVDLTAVNWDTMKPWVSAACRTHSKGRVGAESGTGRGGAAELSQQ